MCAKKIAICGGNHKDYEPERIYGSSSNVAKYVLVWVWGNEFADEDFPKMQQEFDVYIIKSEISLSCFTGIENFLLLQ
jgi:hypothetical protein